MTNYFNSKLAMKEREYDWNRWEFYGSDMPSHRHCAICKLAQPMDAFREDKEEWAGHAYVCKSCELAWQVFLTQHPSAPYEDFEKARFVEVHGTPASRISRFNAAK